MMEKERESRRIMNEILGEAEALKERQGELQAGVGMLQTEEGIIKEIRERYNVIREGEGIAVIVDAGGQASTSDDGLPWYRKLLDAIMRKQ